MNNFDELLICVINFHELLRVIIDKLFVFDIFSCFIVMNITIDDLFSYEMIIFVLKILILE